MEQAVSVGSAGEEVKGRMHRRPHAWFSVVLENPKLMIILGFMVVLFFGAGLRQVVKDPSVDAFVPGDHPAALARDEAREIFGLDDPLIVGLAAPAGESLFTPAALEALRRIHEQVRLVSGVQRNDVVSLASEKAISGRDGDLHVDPILEDGPVTVRTAALAAERLAAMPMLTGRLASASGDTLVLVVPVDDPNHAQETYREVRRIAEAQAPPGVTVHVAGVAGMNARLGETVDGDTRVFIPAAVLTVLVILFIATRTLRALVGPLFVIAASAAVAIGTMGWLGASYYLISTALPVVIMALAVADCLHFSIYYLKARGRRSDGSAREAAEVALARTWLPISVTSITTAAGLVGLSFGAAMQPISEFGVFAAIGVLAAWVFSLTVLPAVTVLLDPRPPASAPANDRPSPLERAISAFSRQALRRPGIAMILLAGFALTLVLLATSARFDYERKRYFAPDDAVRLADIELGQRLGGFNFLDVSVTAAEPGALLTPAALLAIAELRARLVSQPLVSKVTGIDEQIALMHEVLTDAPRGVLPVAARAPAQYIFLYEASAEPDDFRQQIDYAQQRALVRAQLTTDRYSLTAPLVREMETRVAEWSQETGLAATVSGRVAVNEGWMSALAHGHFRGLGLAVVLVFAVAWIAFRRLAPALLAMLPVLVGVVSIYAMMGVFAIDIAPATSMCAAIATGLGVDFGIHLIACLQRRLREGATLAEAFDGQYALVARACFYSALALGVALAVICLSSAPPLRWFGFLVGAGALGSLIGALVVIPAVLSLWHGRLHRGLRHA